MAFDVDFYIFAKEVNSTARPSPNDKLTKSCKANGRIDIINPTISLQLGLGGTNSPAVYNYCYIQNFGRYYFIENWEWEGGLWTAHCAVDVLATYKTEIGNLREYVVRCADRHDGTIADGLYPAKNYYTYNYSTVNNPYIYNPWGMTIVAGIVGSGTTNYYAMQYTTFISIIADLLSDAYAEQVVSHLGLQVNSEAKAIVDPLQYISSVIAIPIPLSDITGSPVPALESIKVGYVTMSRYTTGGILLNGTNIVVNKTFNITDIPQHPLASTRGVYLNQAPWSEYTLDIPPFGSIDLDRTKFDDSLHCSLQIDLPTGGAVLRVYGKYLPNTQRQVEISLLKGEIGVNIQVGQVIAKGMGALTVAQRVANIGSQIMGGITGGGGTGGMIGNQGGALTSRAGSMIGGALALVSGVSGFVKDAIESKIPTAKTVGTLGSYSDLAGQPTVFCTFTHPVDESNNTRGRPLCKEMQLSALAADTSRGTSGYILVADADIRNIHATATERDAIAAFLMGGFYLA